MALSHTSDGESERTPDSDVAPTGKGFSITPKDASILKGHLDEFQTANTETRNRILEMAMGELYALRPSSTIFDKKEAKRKIRIWFYNHYNRPYRQLIRFTRRWSARNVFYHQNKPQVTELTQTICGGVPGSQAFLGALQDATTRLWKKLSSEDQEKYRELAKEWSEDRPPKHIQAKMASTAYRRRIVRDFQTQLYKTCGMRCAVLVAYTDKSGIVRTCMDDWNRHIDNGMYFSDFYPSFRDSRFWKEWLKYASACLETGPEQNLFGNSNVIQITTDANGKPNLPSVTAKDNCLAKFLQAAIWDYCTAHIRYISGYKKACISWSKLSNNPASWILEECYPDDFPWADPSKLRLTQIHELLGHWRLQEKDGKDPIIWNPGCDALNTNEFSSKTIRT